MSIDPRGFYKPLAWLELECMAGALAVSMAFRPSMPLWNGPEFEGFSFDEARASITVGDLTCYKETLAEQDHIIAASRLKAALHRYYLYMTEELDCLRAEGFVDFVAQP